MIKGFFFAMALSVVIFQTLQFSVSAWAQTIDCRGTIQAWLNDRNYRDYAKTCTCSNGNNRSPVCTGGSSGSYGHSHNKGLGMQGMMMQSIMAPMFSAMLAPPPSGPSPAQRAAAEQQRIEAEQQRAAAEKAKTEALKKWAQAQSDEEIRKQVKQQEKLKQGEKVLSQMQSVGGGKLEPFSFGSTGTPVLMTVDTATFPTAKLTEFERLMCSAFFSNMGNQSTSAVDARFYADQAERTMMGQPTYIECRLPKSSGGALAAQTKAAKKVYEEANLKIQELDKLEPKLSEANEKLTTAMTKKDEAAAKVKELEARAAVTPPEQKEEIDPLVAQAQKELQDAEKEAADAQKTQKELADKKAKIENDLNTMKSNAQAGLQAD